MAIGLAVSDKKNLKIWTHTYENEWIHSTWIWKILSFNILQKCPKQLQQKTRRRERKQELDSKGIQPEQCPMDTQQREAFNDTRECSNYNRNKIENTAKNSSTDIKRDTKLDLSLRSAKSIKPTVSRSSRHYDIPVPMVTIVTCPDDTLVMFASLSGK